MKLQYDKAGCCQSNLVIVYKIICVQAIAVQENAAKN
jgi:hypothetical protein